MLASLLPQLAKFARKSPPLHPKIFKECALKRIEAYQELMDKLGGELAESMQRARRWKAQEQERVRNIHHMANADMQGRELQGQKKDSRVQRISNSLPLRIAFDSMSTFDQMLKMFGSKNSNGQGYLWNYYMRSWVDAADKEYTEQIKHRKQMDRKAAELFGRHKLTRRPYSFKDLYAYADACPSMEVEYYDGAAKRKYELEHPALMYLYAVEKMPMGMATNRRMGFTDEIMSQIENALDPRLRQYVDWVQEEMLPELGLQIDEVYQVMNGCHMEVIDNYFPFVRDKDALPLKVENGQEAQPNVLISTMANFLKKRQPSVAVWDLKEMNFFDLLARHVDESCHWLSFATMNRDLSTLLSYNRFKQQVKGMSSIYGASDKLWERFCKVCAITTDAYDPERSGADKMLVQVAKGVTISKIAGRITTAFKQVLSMPAFFGDVNPIYMAGNMATLGIPALKWTWENLPNFRKRIQSRTIGDYRLRSTEYDTKIMKASTWGMLPNIGVDGWTIAIGAYGHYLTQKHKYLRWGMDEAKADRMAKQDATLCFNKSQQSSEGPFMAPIQMDHTWYSTTAMIFRNSSTSYSRETHNSARNLERIMSGEVDVDFMAKQWLRMMEIPSYNEAFNKELEQQIAGTLSAGHIYKLGRPGGILQSAGIEDLPIELSADRLALKASESYRSEHPFPIEAVRDLPKAINAPIAVFDSATRRGVKVILTTLVHNGHNFVVALEAKARNADHKYEVDINNILSIYPKDRVNGVLQWICNGNMTYCDHKKMRAYFTSQWPNYIVEGENALDILVSEAAQSQGQTTDVNYPLLQDATKVVNNFVNPDIKEQKNDPGWSEQDWARARKVAKEEIRRDTVRNSVQELMRLEYGCFRRQ